MIAFVRMAALIAAVAFSWPVLADDASPAGPDPARIAAARDLLEVTGVTRQMDGLVDAMSESFAKGADADTSPEGKKITDEFKARMEKMKTYRDAMISDFATLYAESFTAEEMKTVADFYRSGAGAKFIEMTPDLMKKGAAIGSKYSDKINSEMQTEMPAGEDK